MTNKDKVMTTFAAGILKHFERLGIDGRQEIVIDHVRIILNVKGKNIATRVPYNVISNAMKNIESFGTLRYEIISELTIGLRTIVDDIRRRRV
jgi:hypothetical protein